MKLGIAGKFILFAIALVIVTASAVGAWVHGGMRDDRAPEPRQAIESPAAPAGPFARHDVLALIAALAALGAGLAATICMPLAQRLHTLRAAAEAIAGGDYTAALPKPGRDELGRLAQATQTMMQNVARREEQLRLSEARISAIFDVAADAIVSVDGQQRIVLYNRGAEKIFGWSPAEAMGRPLEMLLPERYARTHRAHVEAFAASPDLARSMTKRREIRGRRRDGSEFPAEASASKLVLNGIPLFTVILRDVSERQAAQEAQARLTAILETTTDFVATADMQGRVLYINRAGRRMLGVGEGEDITVTRIPEYHPEASARLILEEGIPTALRDGAWRGGTVLRARDGREINVSQVILAHRGGTGDTRYLSTIMRDMTEAKKTEKLLRDTNLFLQETLDRLEQAQSQLLQSEKMASIGQLAAGVAHEINNPVGYVNSNLGTLHGYVNDLLRLLAAYEQTEPLLAADPAVKGGIEAVKQELDLAFLRADTLNLVKESQEGLTRVKKIVQDLKEFSHVDQVEWQSVDLHAGLDSTLNIVWNELKYKAEVTKDYGALPLVECLPAQLNQVFMNLLVNAGQAIEMRGTITIRTGTEGDQVWVEVADTGKGMSPDVQKRIFEPFFTTKPVGKGTGLGLSLAYGIVQKHRGRITVASSAGRGTTFRVTLPVCRTDSAVQNAELRSTGT